MQSTIYFVVSGHVQGVFFRALCQGLADQHQITGWVRNLSDGRVEGMATADQSRLEILRDWLRHGPELATVEKLDVLEKPHQIFNGFVIR